MRTTIEVMDGMSFAAFGMDEKTRQVLLSRNTALLSLAHSADETLQERD